MILIVSSIPRERAALLALCESRSWPCAGCASMRALRRHIKSTPLAAIVTRPELADGYSDDLFSTLSASALPSPPKVVVLLGADATAAQEARQIGLGADGVLRDPVRTDVLLEYLAKYRRQAKVRRPQGRGASPRAHGQFAGATIEWAERRLSHAGQSVTLTPREAQLVELLVESRGEVVTYETLYGEILDRRFTGDTNNLRVLLSLLASKVATIGVVLRDWVEVTSKAGYRYRAKPRTTSAGSEITPAPRSTRDSRV